MEVPFLDIKKQNEEIRSLVLNEIDGLISKSSFIGGEAVSRFEKEFAEYIGVKHAVSCGNGTDALVLALRACGVGYGDEVITTSFSFFATAEAIASVGAVPVFADIRRIDFLIDNFCIEELITEKTKAIIPVQLFGCCCDMDKIMEIARRYDLKVIEDDAQAVGSEYKGKKAGSLADIGCFSFYPTKNLGGFGDGGMCVTNDDQLAVSIRALKEHGAGKNGAEARKYLTGKTEELEVGESKTGLYDPYKYYNYLVGYNSRLDAMQAAVLSIKLRHLDRYNEKRRDIAKEYLRCLTDDVILPSYSKYVVPCWHQFVIRTDSKYELIDYMAKHGVGCGSFYPVPLYRQKAFEDIIEPDKYLVDAEAVSRQTVCLPIYPEMTDEQVQFVIQTVNSFFGG